MNKIKNKIYKILRYSEKYTKTDMNYATKSGSWLTVGQIISSASSFLLAIAFANLLPREVYGNYKYILSIFGLLSIFSLPGIGIAVIQAVARKIEGPFHQAFKTKLKWGAVGSLIAIIIGIYYLYQGNTILPIPLFLCALFLPLMQATQIYISLLHGRKLFSWATKFGSMTRILSTASMVGALLLTNSLIWIMFAYLFINTLINTLIYLLTKKKFKPNHQQDEETIRYGKHLSFLEVLGTIGFYFDRFLIFHYLGAVELAIYSLASAPLDQAKKFYGMINAMIFPKFSERNVMEIRRGMKNKFIRLFLITLVIVVIYILIAPYIYRIFFPKYLDSIFYSQLLALSLFGFTFLPASTALRAKKKVKELYFNYILNFVLQIILMICFITWLGLLGLVIARIIIRILSFLNVTFLFYRAYPDTSSESGQHDDLN